MELCKFRHGNLFLLYVIIGVMLGRTISSRIKSFRMRNKAPVGLSRLVCPNGENIRITDAKSDVVQKPLSTDEIFRLNRTCNCRPTCGIPEMITARPPSFYSSWQLTVIYECGEDICSDRHSSGPTRHRSTSIITSTVFPISEKRTHERQTEADTEDKSAIIAVPVVVVFLVAASCITAFILYRRWQRRKSVAGVYQGRTAGRRHNVDGFTNIAYNKTENISKGSKDSHDHSILDTSGYTDINIHDETDDINDEYYTIKEDNIEETTGNFDSQYYVIKDKSNGEYNQIAFTNKVIPDDASYGHTLHQENMKNKMYDHVEGKPSTEKGSYAQIQTMTHFDSLNSNIRTTTNKKREPDHYNHLEDEVLADINNQEDNYSHLNENSAVAKVNILHNPPTKTVSDNNPTTTTTSVDEHSFFILEQTESLQSSRYAAEDDHQYFVSDKESIQNNSGDIHLDQTIAIRQNVARLEKDKDQLNGVGDNTYFEKSREPDLVNDGHEYSEMDESNAAVKTDSIGDEPHDYFVLEKQT